MVDRFIYKFTKKQKRRYPNIAKEFPRMKYHQAFYYKYPDLKTAIKDVKDRNRSLVHLRIILVSDRKRKVVYKR